MEEVKSALACGSASNGTVATLERLLRSTEPTGRTRPASTNTEKASATASRTNTARPKGRSKASQLVDICEDFCDALPPRAKYALVTDVVNSSLKILTQAAKSANTTLSRPKGALSATPRSLSRTSSGSGVLQPRSGNSSPVSVRAKTIAKSGLDNAEAVSRDVSAQLLATAECARVAFYHLRSIDTQKLGLKDQRKWQLETGMLALAGKLVTLGMDPLAVKELRILKRRLQAGKPCGASTESEKETLATLLAFDSGFKEDGVALSLAISYQMLVLRIVAASWKPATIEAVIEYLSLDCVTSPVNLIQEQLRSSGDSNKAAKQLENLAQIILSLCSAPRAAKPEESVTAEDTFVLQTLALRIRQRWWALAKHNFDSEKELLEPFSRCLTTFARRSATSSEAHKPYHAAKVAYESLEINLGASDSDASFDISRTMCELSEAGEEHDESLLWARSLLEACVSLEPQNARRVACVVRLARLSSSFPSTSSQPHKRADHLKTAIENLGAQINGHTSDYDLLLTELAKLVRELQNQTRKNREDALHLTVLAAGFAQRYARSYADRSEVTVRSIIFAALRACRTIDEVSKWISRDTVVVMAKAGSLRAVAEMAARKSPATAWSCSAATIALARVVHALMIRSIKTFDGSTAQVYDVEELNPDERGLLLVKQLEHAMEMAARPKYRAALQKLVPDALRRLSKLCTVAEYPIRRMRLATQVLQWREMYPEVLPPHATKIWLDEITTDEGALGEDTELQLYLADIRAGWQVAKAFYDGRPESSLLRPALQAWQLILDTDSENEHSTDVYDAESTIRQLQVVASYFGMQGDDQARLPVLRLALKLLQRSSFSAEQQCEAAIALAKQYLELGYSEKSGDVLAQALKLSHGGEMPHMTMAKLKLGYANYFLAIDNTEKAREAMEQARRLRDEGFPEPNGRCERRAHEMLHADAWLTQSRLLYSTGMASHALEAAKTAVKLLNASWAAMERSVSGSDPKATPEVPDAIDPQPDVQGLASGVSKLQLTPKEPDESHQPPVRTERGAQFWTIVPLLNQALLHLSDMFSNHGLFHEADYYSQRAISILESAGSTVLLSRARSHRVRLLTLADRLEEAELCLSKSEDTGVPETSLAMVDRIEAKASILAKEGAADEAIDLYQHAEAVCERMQSDTFVAFLEKSASPADDLDDKMQALTLGTTKAPIEATQSTVSTTKVARQTTPASRTKAKVPAVNARSTKKATVANGKQAPETAAQCYLLTKSKARLTIRRGLLYLQNGHEDAASLVIQTFDASAMQSQRHLDFRKVMKKVSLAMQTDVSFNVLPESTISFPALLSDSRRCSEQAATQSLLVASSQQAVKRAVVPSKRGAKKATVDEQLADLLMAARNCLIRSSNATSCLNSTVDTYRQCSSLASVSMLLSAAALGLAESAIHPVREALNVELPSMHALQCETNAIRFDGSGAPSNALLSWPEDRNSTSNHNFSAAGFQEQYVNILPKSWTAVSLCLNEDCTELYAVRYRADQSPLILRLPFSRHKADADDEDEEAFDYQKGKAELQDIIQASNYSCHNGGGMESKGAKSNWWSEREALDRRLHELLINIENIWFGGFKGIFSQLPRHLELLGRFRKSFDDILARYLPSRKASKGRGKTLALDNKVLELFIGLGSDHDGSVDLDEPLADLLYFVVDMLQFNGERNAYDEIDFDSMAVEILDALRSYHEACPQVGDEDRHLVLVLDKRLQAFPCENLPCLETASVSRVGSMLSLRDRLMAMRSRKLPDSQYEVSRKSGTYILNPSKDLTNTQSILAPPLAKLQEAEGAKWNGMIQQEPIEDDFRDALTDSSMLLFFGHGAGSQYIRPRTIRKMEKCSEVVWLMGCSSGAVTEYGELEPFAVPLAYMMAGSKDRTIEDQSGDGRCMAVVATLWDVTDKDIDRFSLAMGEEWGLWPPSEGSKLPTKTPKKRELLVAPSTPQQVPKTPKTPKVKKTPAPAKTPARSRSRGQPARAVGKKRSLAEAVTRSRDACYLRYLNGAAPVVYGVPVYLGD